MAGHPHIQLVVDSARKYRQREIDIEGLQRNLSAALGALEGDVPKAVHEAIRKAEAWVDSIRFTASRTDQPVQVERVLAELEAVIDRWSPA